MLVAVLVAAAALAAAPKPAPGLFVSDEYGLAFRAPKAAHYCPLPEGWVGADRGVIPFLSPPQRCGDADFASTEREFAPRQTPRLELAYAYAADPAQPPCDAVGEVRLLGQSRPICRAIVDGLPAAIVKARWRLPQEAEVTVTLVSSPERFADDLETLKRFAASGRTCTQSWVDPRTLKAARSGVGPPCPRDGRWF